MKPSKVTTALRHLAGQDVISRENDPVDLWATRVLPTPPVVGNARRIEDTGVRMLYEVLDDLDTDLPQVLPHALPALRALEAALRTRHSTPQTASR